MIRDTNNTNNADKLIFMADNAKIKFDLQEQISYKKAIDKLYYEVNPKTAFALHTKNQAVLDAYENMVNPKGKNTTLAEHKKAIRFHLGKLIDQHGKD